MTSKTLEDTKKVLEVEKYYKEKVIIDRCTNIQKNAKYLAEQIKEQKTNNVYLGSLKSEVDELINTFHELQSTAEQLKLIQKLIEEA